MGVLSVCLLLAGIAPGFLLAQEHTFASLSGKSPDLSSWNLISEARLGDTPGDTNTLPDEIILCPALPFRNGALFYREPIDLSVCSKWAVSFEFRMAGGSGADGIAFCFLVNPPTGYIAGGGVGLPSNPRGLMVVLDTWNNCGGANPELQIRYGDGNTNYNECPLVPQPTLYGLSSLRSENYTRARVEYNRGQIRVSIGDQITLEGFFPINYSGYIGFTSSTGAATDVHSLRNVTITTQIPEISTIPDTSYCINDSLVVETAPGFSVLGWSDGSKATKRVIRDTGLYWLKLENQCGTFIDSFRVRRQDPFQYDLEPDRQFCFGGKVTLDAGEGFQAFRWSDGTSSRTTTISQAGVYSVRVRKGSCWATDSIRVSGLPPGRADLGRDTAFCRGDSIQLSVLGRNATWLWSTGQTTPAIMVAIPGDYRVTVTDTAGCIAYGSRKVGQNELPELVSYDDAVPFRVTIEARGGTPPYSYSRDNQFFQPSKTLSIISGNRYSLYVRDANGCRDQRLGLILGKPQVVPPNFFTPNGDGFHDTWEVEGISAFPNSQIAIFDRSGRLLASYPGIALGWDGTYQALPMPENDYWYVIDLKNGQAPKKGHITLKRQ